MKKHLDQLGLGIFELLCTKSKEERIKKRTENAAPTGYQPSRIFDMLGNRTLISYLVFLLVDVMITRTYYDVMFSLN